jgi:hypothetical protein
VTSRVIGYYEVSTLRDSLKVRVANIDQSWSDRLACHKVSPADLPLDALTQYDSSKPDFCVPC